MLRLGSAGACVSSGPPRAASSRSSAPIPMGFWGTAAVAAARMPTSCLPSAATAPTVSPVWPISGAAGGVIPCRSDLDAGQLAPHVSRAGRPSAWPAEGLNRPETGAMRPSGGGNAAVPPPGQGRLESRRARGYDPFSGFFGQYCGVGTTIYDRLYAFSWRPSTGYFPYQQE